jgi:hypothetical protein
MADDAPAPIGIDRSRHCDLHGRGYHVWLRRLTLVAVACLPVLGLINVFGQHEDAITYTSRTATLKVISPVHYRGGLLFTTEIVMTPHEKLHDGQLRLGNGWFTNMTVNAVTPQPSTETSQGPWQVWDFGQMSADTPYRVWIGWQVNPTKVGQYRETIAFYDHATPLVGGARTVTVFA